MGVHEFLESLVQHIRSEDARLVIMESNERGRAEPWKNFDPESQKKTRIGSTAEGGPEAADPQDTLVNRSARQFEPVFVRHAGKRILRLDFAGLSHSSAELHHGGPGSPWNNRRRCAFSPCSPPL